MKYLASVLLVAFLAACTGKPAVVGCPVGEVEDRWGECVEVVDTVDPRKEQN